MKKIRITLSFFLFLLSVSIYFNSCKKTTLGSEEAQGSPNLPEQSYDYFSKHGVNSDYATLGRVLFFDKSLSVNNVISCGGCHKQEFAFANNVQFDKGFNGLMLKRNSPSIQGFRAFNAFNGTPTKENQLQSLLFWDGRQTNMADMVLNPVFNHNEMNMPGFEELISKLGALSYYPQLFKKAFGDEAITKERIAFAMEAFICCLNTKRVDNNTPFDPNANTTPFNINPTNLVEMGEFLFHTKYNCAKCHDQKGNPQETGPYSNPVDPTQMFNIGLDEVYSDKGLGQLTGRPGDHGLFKVPTLRNISVTAPYMHDGRFANLSQVLDHYSHGIKPNANLSPLFKNLDGTPKNLNILPAEKNAIIAFLNTLKDEDFLTSPMYSDPFKK